MSRRSQAKYRLLVAGVVLLMSFIFNKNAIAQQQDQVVRVAKVRVDAGQLVQYNKALKEQMETAIRLEPGVLSYYAVADKKDHTSITIFEIYANMASYKAHIETPHFKKYKTTVAHMVKSLELTDVDIIGVAKKPGM
ncbi:putative quinol monooxygenase [Mucilaginibacter galii]